MNPPARRAPSLGDRVEYALFRFLLLILSRLSWNGARRLGRLLGGIAFDLIRIRRRVTLENLAHAFPEWSLARRLSVARESYRNIGITFMELFVIPRLGPREIAERAIIQEPAVFDEAVASGRGAVLYTGHIGNWELVGSALAARGHRLHVLVKPQSNELVDRHVQKTRERAGMRTLSTRGGLRPVLRALRSNEFVAFVADQDAGRDGVFVPFFGRLASAAAGPARFARRAGCPIIFGFSVRQPDGACRLEMPPPLCVSRDLPAVEAETRAVAECASLLEETIRRYPEQWFWAHRRWKTRPSGG